ncbi:TetR/AcrR family transcriptional regulator C-terminal domain-containing protein [Streptomyces sp. NPDC046870]|uniref:TetR/AcrR family transcriptional regulator C-terminal domain-containing protein n=1 Tax=Streptomyces sp. NPDC046870 TaxID=3155135 RepID=UPI0034540D09
MPLTTQRIAEAALAVLRRDGLSLLSLRAVATELGVHHNAVRWHVSTKTGLLELVSDRIVADCLDEPLPPATDERLFELWSRLRAALLRYRDGARLVTGVTTTGPHTLALSEVSVSALLEQGRDPQEAVWLHWALFYFVLGLTAEEQSFDETLVSSLAETVTTEAHPTLSRPDIMTHMVRGDFDQRFAFGVRRLLTTDRNR